MEMTISGKLISYDVIGSGAPILFVHGWGGSKDSLRRLAEKMQDTHQCYLVDLPGFGESERPPLDWGLEGYADLVRKFILELNVSPISYVGHSFGGALGIALASSSIDLIDRLVVISPSYRRPLSRKLKNFDLSYIRKALWPLRKLAYRILYPGSMALKFAQLEGNFRRIVATDLTDGIGKIKCRTLIIWPADDVECPLNDAYVLRDGVKDSELVVLGGQSHILPISDPELIADKMKEFLS
jgi:pimeloyl-ACP methyl ester carboxylesterase